MKRIGFLILTLIAVLSMAEGRLANRKISLLVANCKAGEGVCETQELVSYHFENGEYVSKELVLSAPTDEVRYDLGGNFIFHNRYLVTNWGDVIDIQKKKLIHKGDGEFIGIERNQIFNKVNRVDVKGIFVFDLITNKYARAKSPNIWEFNGTPSPDKTKVARFQITARNKKRFAEAIVIEQVGKKITLKADLGAECSVRCSDSYRVPFIWIDNERILTQKSNGELIVLSLDGEVKPLLKIKLDETPDFLPSFYRTEDGSIYYRFNGKDYWIDLENRAFKEDWVKLGNSFEVNTGDAFWKSIYFEGREIGKIWGSSTDSTKDFIALAYANEGVNLGSPKGIKVWNRTKNDWITIDIDWGARIIGWVEE